MKKKMMVLMICAMLLFVSLVHASENVRQGSFEAKASGVLITIPEEYKTLKGAVEFTDQGDYMTAGKGIVQMNCIYYPMTDEELDKMLEEEATAEMAGDKAAVDTILDQMNGKVVFRIYGINEDRGFDELIDDLIPAYEEVKEFYTEEEYEEVTARDKETMRNNSHKELGTSDGFTYFLAADDPETLKNEDTFPGYEDGYYEEYISLVENYEQIADYVQLTGNVRLTGQADLADAGNRIEFETRDLDGNTVTSADLFAGHTITMINLWATWCGPCRGELPELEELNRELADKNCQIIGIVTDADKEKKIAKAKEILAENEVTYLNLVPFEGEDEQLPQDCWPTTYFVDENGVLIGEAIRGAAPGVYEEAFDKLLQ